MRKTITILALTVAGLVVSADTSSAQGRRRGYQPVYTQPTYSYPTYTYANTGVQVGTPITTVSGNSWVYGSQPVYTSNYYTPSYYSAPTYSNWGTNNWGTNNWGYYNSGYSPAYSNWNNGWGVNNGVYLNSPALQLNSIIRSWVR